MFTLSRCFIGNSEIYVLTPITCTTIKAFIKLLEEPQGSLKIKI